MIKRLSGRGHGLKNTGFHDIGAGPGLTGDGGNGRIPATLGDPECVQE
jgi:hypothetical protein